MTAPNYIVCLTILVLIPGSVSEMRGGTIEGSIGGESVEATGRMNLRSSVGLRDPSRANTARGRGLLRKWELKGVGTMR